MVFGRPGSTLDPKALAVETVYLSLAVSLGQTQDKFLFCVIS